MPFYGETVSTWDGADAPAVAGAPPLPCLKRHNCITGSQRRSAFAFELNVCEMVRQVGLGRCFEFTVTTPDNCVMGWQFQERWHSLYTNVLRKLFRSGCGARERQKRGAIHMHSVVEMPFECEPFPWNEVRNGCYKHVDRRLVLLWRYQGGFCRNTGSVVFGWCRSGRMEGLQLVILRSMSLRHLNVVMSGTVVRGGGAPGDLRGGRSAVSHSFAVRRVSRLAGWRRFLGSKRMKTLNEF